MKNRQIFFGMLLVMLFLSGSRLVLAQAASTTKTDEQTLRELIQQQNAGKDVIKFTEEAIFVSGAYPRPIIGREQQDANRPKREALEKSRPHQELKVDMQRLVVSQSGDMAYDFGDFTISYDGPDKKRTGFSGSYIRVWRKVGGNWLVDVQFARPDQS